MSEEGKNLNDFFKEFRRINKQIQLLLKTIDESMKKEGWKFQNTVCKYGSDSIDCPEKWYPWFLFRFYIKKPKYNNILMYASVLLDNDIWGEYKLSEPLVTVGYFNFGKKESSYYEWFARWFEYIENRKEDGSICNSRSYKNWRYEWKKDWGKDFTSIDDIQEWKCFGLPLTSINSKNIQSKIIDPFLGMIPKK